MPVIAQIRIIDGEPWCHVPIVGDQGAISLWTETEREQFHRGTQQAEREECAERIDAKFLARIRDIKRDRNDAPNTLAWRQRDAIAAALDVFRKELVAQIRKPV